jgi:hypothetical protein
VSIRGVDEKALCVLAECWSAIAVGIAALKADQAPRAYDTRAHFIVSQSSVHRVTIIGHF